MVSHNGSFRFILSRNLYIYNTNNKKAAVRSQGRLPAIILPMKPHKLFLIFTLFSFALSCTEKKASNIGIEVNEMEIIRGGRMVTAVPFQVADENGKHIPDKGINIIKPYVKNLFDDDLIFLPDSSAILIIDYPSKKSKGYRVFSKNGFTKKEIIFKASKFYNEAYKTESKVGKNEMSKFELHMVGVFKTDGQTYIVLNPEW